MNIAIMGAGHIGGALAKGWSRAGHRIYLGVKDPQTFNADALLSADDNITAHSVAEAAQVADLIVVSVPSKAVLNVAQQIDSAEDKVIVDATNGPIGTSDYPNAVAALKALTGSTSVVKCFKTTGFENLGNPQYQTEGIDMFMAGSSPEAKQTVRQLALDLGFAECYDLGDDAKISLVEQLAFVWVTLAFGSGLGRDFALKVLKR